MNKHNFLLLFSLPESSQVKSILISFPWCVILLTLTALVRNLGNKVILWWIVPYNVWNTTMQERFIGYRAFISKMNFFSARCFSAVCGRLIGPAWQFGNVIHLRCEALLCAKPTVLRILLLYTCMINCSFLQKYLPLTVVLTCIKREICFYIFLLLQD